MFRTCLPAGRYKENVNLVNPVGEVPPQAAKFKWQRIEGLFLALGAQAIEGRGSRVRFELNGVVATFHRPHPHKEAKP